MNNPRKCIATHKSKPKEELIRIVKTKDGEFHIDSEVKGRGAYISRDASLINKLIKQRLLNRSFKVNVPQKVYEKLAKIMEGDKNER